MKFCDGRIEGLNSKFRRIDRIKSCNNIADAEKGGKEQLNKVSLLREFHLNKSAKETSKTKIWVWQNEGVVYHAVQAVHAFFLRNQTGIEAINKYLCKYIPTF